LGRPTIEGKTARGASSPAKPALTMPLPLSITSAWSPDSGSAAACAGKDEWKERRGNERRNSELQQGKDEVTRNNVISSRHGSHHFFFLDLQ